MTYHLDKPNPHWLSEKLEPDHWEGVYEEDYYRYLRHTAFVRTFLEPIAVIINGFGEPCLDVACGEGILANLTSVPYLGIEASSIALSKAALDTHRPRCTFTKGRLEDPGSIPVFHQWSTVVFSGVLQVLIQAEYRAELLAAYRHIFLAKRFIICDLEFMDEGFLSDYQILWRYENEIPKEAIDIPEVKRKRKILVVEPKQ